MPAPWSGFDLGYLLSPHGFGTGHQNKYQGCTYAIMPGIT